MPHQPLRYQLTKGVKTAVELEADVEIVTPTFQRTMPTTVTVMEIGADDVLPDGSAKVRTTILRTSVRDRPGATALEAMNAHGMMMSGVEITGTLTPRGRIQDPKLAGSASMPPKVAEGVAMLIGQTEEVAMPLPEPGVGVGAIWRVRRDVDVAELGIKMQTITEIEVKALDGQRVTYAMRTQVKGDSKRSTIDGVEVDITNVRGSGGGKGVIDLGRMVIFGEESVELGFDLSAKSGSGSVTMRKAKRIRPADAEAAAPPPSKPDAGTPGKPSKPEKSPQDPGAH
jgi:hypothetical protein